MYTDGIRKARTWGTIIPRKNSRGTTYEARYSHNGKRICRNFQDRLSAQSWLSSEKALVDADHAGLQRWTSPTERETASKEKAERTVTLGEWLTTWGGALGRHQGGRHTDGDSHTTEAPRIPALYRRHLS